MQRIDDPSNVPTLPSPLATVSPGYFRRPSILAGDQGTIVTADFLNDVQENLVQVILDAGLSLAKGTGTKLRDAIAAKIAAHLAVSASEAVVGHARFATTAEALAGTLGTAFLAPLRLKEAFPASIANPGYLRIRTPAALITVNFGRATVNNSSTLTVTLAQAFATANLAVVATPDLTGAFGVTGASGAWPTVANPLTQIDLRNSTERTMPLSWLAIGY